MAEISRRSLIGYTGTAAAGAVLAAGGTAHAQDAEAAGTQPARAGAQDADTAKAAGALDASANLPGNTTFSGTYHDPATGAELDLSFTVSVVDYDTPNRLITPLQVATALNSLAEAHGWPALTFYYTPAPVPLN